MDNLLIQLRQLKLTAMACAVEEQRLAPHTYPELAFEERLGLLVEQEHLARENNRLQRLRKQAQLRLKASPVGLRYPANRGLRAEQVTPLLQGHHLTNHQNVLITGPTIADALLDRLIHNAYRLELKGESQRKNTLVQPDEVG